MKKALVMMCLAALTVGMLSSCKTKNAKTTEAENNTTEAEWVDLGLPSGTQWKSVNEEGYYTYDEAVEKFGRSLPSDTLWYELECCDWSWTGDGYTVVGPNGNSIFLPAAGIRSCEGAVVMEANNGPMGSYWSSIVEDQDSRNAKIWIIDSTIYNNAGNPRCLGGSVRLVQRVEE